METMNVKVPKMIEVYARGVKATLDLSTVPVDAVTAVLAYVIGYGFNQTGQDAGASETKAAHEGNEAAAHKAGAEKARARWNALLAGKVPEGGGMRAADPKASTLVAMLRSPGIRKVASTAYESTAVPKASDGYAKALAFAKAHFNAKKLGAIVAAIE